MKLEDSVPSGICRVLESELEAKIWIVEHDDSGDYVEVVGGQSGEWLFCLADGNVDCEHTRAVKRHLQEEPTTWERPLAEHEAEFNRG